MGLPTHAEFGLASRFLRDERKISQLLFELLKLTPIFSNGKFHVTKQLSMYDLSEFFAKVCELKPVIENLFDAEVRKSKDHAVSQLSSVLKIVGLELSSVGKTRSKFIRGGQTTYIYELDADKLNKVRAISSQRGKIKGWSFLYDHYGWTQPDIEANEED